MRRLIVLLLTLLLCGCQKQAELPENQELLQQIGEFSLQEESYTLRNRDVRTIVLAGVSDFSDHQRALNALIILTFDLESGGVEIMYVPPATRTKILAGEEGELSVQYGPIEEAYAQDTMDFGTANLMEGIGMLLGGAQIDGYVLYTGDGLMRAVNALDGVEVPFSSQLVGSSLPTAGTGLLHGADALLYGNYMAEELQIESILWNRRLVLAQSIIARMEEKGVSESIEKMIARCAGSIRHNFTPELIEEIAEAIEKDKPVIERMNNTVLWGEERTLDNSDYYLPNATLLKQWVLRIFYDVQGM